VLCVIFATALRNIVANNYLEVPMAKRVEGVSESLLACAMREFLAKGYNGASMRTIAENAGTTPRSIYTRYDDKEGLFAALVEDAAQELKAFFADRMQEYSLRSVEKQKKLFHDEDFEKEYKGYLQHITDLLYERRDCFKLLICCSDGSRYAGFEEEIADLEEAYTLKYIEETDNDVIRSGRAGKQLIHLLCGSYMYGLFEVIRHDMTKAEAELHIAQLNQFFSHGWDKLFNP